MNEPDYTSKIDGLPHLEADIRDYLQRLDYPKRDWLTPRGTQAGQPILDVLVVGGGQGGLCTAFALMREKVSNLLVLDSHPRATVNTLRRCAEEAPILVLLDDFAVGLRSPAMRTEDC